MPNADPRMLARARGMIVRDIERSGTGLVVLGARGLGAVRRLLLGSVSEAVLNQAACSALIVRGRKS